MFDRSESSQQKIASRKDAHLRINCEEDVYSKVDAGFKNLILRHCALPEVDFKQIDTSVAFLSRNINAPIFISSMTGGTEEGNRINQRLAKSAESFGIPMGVGSQRIDIQNENIVFKKDLRKIAPTIPLYANLGAVQLNYGMGVSHCQQAVDLIEADGLILHLNPLQEVLQPEGQTNFAELIEKIAEICRRISVPVIVKEVGWGISVEVAEKLIEAGVSCIDVAGAGGTSWALVEKFRNTEPTRIDMCDHFSDWGIPTVQCLKEIRRDFPAIPMIGSGGIKTGIDVAKCIAMGASLAGTAGPLFRVAAESQEALDFKLKQFVDELKIAMFVTGSKNLDELRQGKIINSNG